MRLRITLCLFLINTFMFINLSAQELPLVYEVENTGANYPKPPLLTIDKLPTITALPDPFVWSDGRGSISSIYDWKYRRAEIGAEIQFYEIGEKPVRPDTIQASYSGGILTVVVTKNGKTLTLTSQVILPEGTGPFPAVIGLGGFDGSGSIPPEIFSSRNIAQITFNHNQVTSYSSPSDSNPYYQLYPHLNLSNTGQYSAWAWGISRLIDGLELVKDVLPIDIKHLAVTGCSYAGKMALFAGAFDERIALTISQESGGGGYTTWRVSQLKAGSVETLGATDYNWFKDNMKQFSNAVSKLPEDHHELMAMVAPRALLVTGNPDFIWLSDESGHVGSNAAKGVWNALGIPDRFGYSIVSGHPHCNVPDNQVPEIEAFVDKFLLGKNDVNTNVSTTPYTTNLTSWITWSTPTLSTNESHLSWTSLIYPADSQKGLDKSVSLRWNKVNDAEKYYIQVSTEPAFNSILISDSTTTDTVKTIGGLLDGKRYYWRVQVKNNTGSSGPFSNIWSFSTYIPSPVAPQLVDAVPSQDRPGNITFKWRKVEYADQYIIQLSHSESFPSIFKSDSTTSDTSKTFSGLSVGRQDYWRVQAKNITGSSAWSSSSFTIPVVDVKVEGVPTEYSLSQNYPNPFNPTTKLKFALPKASVTKLIIYNLLGSEVLTLVNKVLEAGYHEINFDAGNFPSGVYFYRIQSGDFTQTKKMILMK